MGSGYSGGSTSQGDTPSGSGDSGGQGLQQALAEVRSAPNTASSGGDGDVRAVPLDLHDDLIGKGDNPGAAPGGVGAPGGAQGGSPPGGGEEGLGAFGNGADSSNAPEANQPGDSSSSGSTSSSGSNNWRTQVSHISEQREVESMNMVDPPDMTNIGMSPGEFADNSLHPGTHARRLQLGRDGYVSGVESMDQPNSGTWQSFSSDNIIEERPIGQASDTVGRTADFMSEATLSESPTRATDTAYLTDYSPEFDPPITARTPTADNAQIELASSAALSSIGVEVPRHAFDEQTGKVAKESVSRDGYDAVIIDDGEIPEEYAKKADAEQVEQMLAAHAVAGNTDITPDNVAIGEDGRVIPFDLDWHTSYRDGATLETQINSPVYRTVEKINSKRDDPLDVDASSVVDTAEDLADDLVETGTVHRMAASAKQYDEYIEEREDDLTGATMDRGVHQRIYQHVHALSESGIDRNNTVGDIL